MNVAKPSSSLSATQTIVSRGRTASTCAVNTPQSTLCSFIATANAANTAASNSATHAICLSSEYVCFRSLRLPNAKLCAGWCSLQWGSFQFDQKVHEFVYGGSDTAGALNWIVPRFSACEHLSRLDQERSCINCTYGLFCCAAPDCCLLATPDQTATAVTASTSSAPTRTATGTHFETLSALREHYRYPSLHSSAFARDETVERDLHLQVHYYCKGCVLDALYAVGLLRPLGAIVLDYFPPRLLEKPEHKQRSSTHDISLFDD